MVLEQELIPYTTSELPPSPWLILAPHPDDESIGMGGTIRLAYEQGITVWTVVVTDGAKGGAPNTRRQEAEEAAKRLGIERLVFWNISDRKINEHSISFKENLIQIIYELKPRTIFLPSCFEFHPDHRLTSHLALLCLKEHNVNAKVWLYEISRQGEVNKLIDITKVIRLKREAINCYKSQIDKVNYSEIAISLNRIRAYTLPNHVEFAEGFWELTNYNLFDIQSKYKKYFFQRDIEYPLVSIIIRTKDRPKLLREALQSIAIQDYGYIETIVVNDGGENVQSIVQEFNNLIYKIQYIHNKQSVGRAAAANIGLKAASGEWTGLLDDDDVLLPNAISLLIANSKSTKAVYGKVSLVLYDTSDYKKIGEFAYPFLKEALFVNNYIPTCGFLFKRDLALDIGGFDESFDFLEDWDFNFRLAQKTNFLFIPYDVALYRIFGTGFILDANYEIESKWRELFYKKHIHNIDTTILSKGYYQFIKMNKVENEKLKRDIYSLKKEKQKLTQENQRLYYEQQKIYSDYKQNLKEKKELNNTLQTLYNSTSWRITHPLRVIALFARNNLIVRFFDEFVHGGPRSAFRKTANYLCEKSKKVSFFKEESLFFFRERKKVLSSLSYTPLISIIVPVYNTPPKFLKKCIKSVLKQYYPKWEMCLVDGNSNNKKIKNILKKSAKKDNRIKIKFLSDNKGIAGNSNEALSMTKGEFIALLDHDDELSPTALLEVVKFLNKNPKLDFIYTDEDKISTFNKKCHPHFKPDWSPDLMRSYNYIGHLAVIRKKIIDQVGGFRSEYDGSQDYDLFLRIIEKTKQIGHIPKVLYHWRMHKHSFSENLHAKSGAYKAAKKALSEHLKRVDLKGKVLDGFFLGSYRIKYYISNNPKIDIIIPNKDNVDILHQCIESILNRSTYKNYKIVIVDNQSKENDTFKYYNSIIKNPKISILKYDKKFNWSKLNNFAVQHTNSEYILFLNNDVEVITPDWLECMLEFIQRDDVGAVGSLLYYPNNTVQHAGVIIGLGGIAGHAHAGVPREDKGYFGRLRVIQNFSAVTGACMLTKRKIFQEVGGFDKNLPYDFNDVDYCLKLREKNFLIVYTPFAELYHHESLTRGQFLTEERLTLLSKASTYMQQKWGSLLSSGDPYYNPNFSLKHPFVPK